MEHIKKDFWIGPKVDYKALVKEGAILLDVRTDAEFRSGHLPKATHIPLNELSMRMKKLNKSTPVICYCASGMRSAMAMRQLKLAGFQHVFNGGGMMKLQGRLSEN